ncbi:uncharacterized protein [Palaemon carinicauda]|uniref:uncharacterized protein n=1 Tax=Palaemon carinicauda TaxID=392227 RepID=UPI0035B60A1E
MASENCENKFNARVFPVGDTLGPHLIPPKNRQRLPSHGQAGLKRQAQRKISEERMRVATLNVGTMTGKGRELVDLMERRKIGVLCVQETKWKGNKAKELGEGCKFCNSGANMEGRNGVLESVRLHEDVQEWWTENSKVILRISRKCLESNQEEEPPNDKESWWWNDEVQERETYFEGQLNEETPRTVFEDELPNEAVTLGVTRREVAQAIKKMKNSKAAGLYNIPVEVWKSLGEEGIDILWHLTQKIFSQEKMPEEWRSLIIPI